MGNKKNMHNFWNELNEYDNNKIALRDFLEIKEFKLEENNNNNIKKNLFNEFDKKESFKLSSKFSFDNNNNNNQDEEEKVRKEDYYNKLINQVNLFENFNVSLKPEFKDETKMDIDNEIETKIYEKEEEGKNY